MKTKKAVKPAMAMVTALFLLGGYSAQATAATVDIPTTTTSQSFAGCVSIQSDCQVGQGATDNEDDTFNLFGLEPDVGGFNVFLDPGPTTPSSDIGSANVLLNGGLVGTLSTANPSVAAAFPDSLAQVVEIVNTDAVLLNYVLDVTPAPAVVPIPAAVWLFGSGLLGLVGVARRRRGLSAA